MKSVGSWYSSFSRINSFAGEEFSHFDHIFRVLIIAAETMDSVTSIKGYSSVNVNSVVDQKANDFQKSFGAAITAQ